MTDACGPYKLGPLLAKGGMAEIFAATPGPGAPQGLPAGLVVKRLLPRHASRPDFIRLFQREAEIVRQLDHPGIVKVFDVGQDGDSHYMVMERIHGRDLKAVMSGAAERGEPLPFGLAALIAARVAEALDHAHELSDEEGWPLGLVHRDICPHNVLVSWQGDVKLSDFGIARAADRAAGVRPGQLTGRVGYLSPEQVQGLEVDSRSDVFSLGVVLWEMTVGRRLFKAPSQIETMQQVQEARVTAPAELRADCPAALQAAILKALAREVRDRHDSAGSLARELDAFLAGASGPADRPALAARMVAWFPQDTVDTSQIGAPASTPAPTPAPTHDDDEDDEATAIVNIEEAQALLAASEAAALDAAEDTEDGIGTSPGMQALQDDPGPAHPAPAAPSASPPSPDDLPADPGAARDIDPFEGTAEAEAWDEAETSVQDALDEARIDSPSPGALAGGDDPGEPPAPAASEAVTPVPPASGPPTQPPLRAEPAPEMPPHAGSVEPMGVVMGVPMTPAAAEAGFDESLLAETSPVGPVPPRPARGERPRAISRVHDIPSIGDENAEDVYLSLAVQKRSISGWAGFGAVVAAAVLIAVVYQFVGMGNVAQEKVFAEARAVAEQEKEALAAAMAPDAKPEADALMGVRSDPPGAIVSVDWQQVERPTPTKVAVFKGQVHLLRVELPGHGAYEETLTVPAEGGLERNVMLIPQAADAKTGAAAVVTEPEGAELFVAGQARGTTPVMVGELAAGRSHSVLLKAPGYTPHVVVFTVDEGGQVPITVRLSPSDVDGATKRDLHIESSPTGASVHIDGGRAGSTPLFRRLNSGDRTHLVLDRAGYKPFETPVAVGPAAVTVMATLEQLPAQFGFLSLVSTPAKAKVYIGNSEVGRTPIKKHKLSVGEHTVVLDTPKHRGSFVVEMGADERLSHKVSWDSSGKLVVQ